MMTHSGIAASVGTRAIAQRKHTSRLKYVGFVPVSLLLMAASAGSAQAQAQAQAPIKIGVSVSMSGPNEIFSRNRERAIQLCLKQANEKGGVLGRRLELVIEDDKSNAATAVKAYESLITEKRVDAVFGPYGSPLTDAVADVTEKHGKPLLATVGTASIYRKGRRFVFMVSPPAEAAQEGVVDLAAKRGLKTLAIIGEDSLFTRAVAQGAVEHAKRKGLQVVLSETYPKGTTDFGAQMTRVRSANPDVLVAATYFDDAVAIARQMKALDINPKMFGVTAGGASRKFYETLGKDAEFIYSNTQWEPDLVTLRAGGLIPIARQFPGAREFVEAHHKEYPSASLTYHSASGYAGCELLIEAIRQAGSLDGERIRNVILKLDTNTVFGRFKVDSTGYQVAQQMLAIQWQDGKKAIVWPDGLAPTAARFPTPPWNTRP
jgi:branched-chain amino acid transport system substrate-binding protein